uniref:Uncharacterized protein n=1 Tax=Acrobeloides nanus TaxID=290746 RepID=A0A914DQQ0_9BILA
MLENGQLSLDYNKSMDDSNAYCKDIVLKNGLPSSSSCLSKLPHQLKPIQNLNEPSYVSITDGSDSPIVVVGKDGKVRKIYPSAQNYTPKNMPNNKISQNNTNYSNLHHNGPIIREITDEEEEGIIRKEENNQKNFRRNY